jgi:hypothetical protein
MFGSVYWTDMSTIFTHDELPRTDPPIYQRDINQRVWAYAWLNRRWVDVSDLTLRHLFYVPLSPAVIPGPLNGKEPGRSIVAEAFGTAPIGLTHLLVVRQQSDLGPTLGLAVSSAPLPGTTGLPSWEMVSNSGA